VRPQVSRSIRALLALSAVILAAVIIFTPSEFNLTLHAHVRPVYLSKARAYVIETASPGYTMTLQGAEVAIERFHPEFVVRLANAIREARSAGLSLRACSRHIDPRPSESAPSPISLTLCTATGSPSMSMALDGPDLLKRSCGTRLLPGMG
jgi:hypothetical protein